MALPPTIVMVLAVVVIMLAARPLDPTPPVMEALAERPAPAPVVEAEPDSSRADIVDAPIAKRLDQEARPVERRRALVPPPERVVYVHGWRVRPVPSGPQPSRRANGLSARRGALTLEEARWPLPGSAVQAP